MKLIGNLKDKVDKAKTMEAKKDIIAEAGMELADDELEGVVGGINLKINNNKLVTDQIKRQMDGNKKKVNEKLKQVIEYTDNYTKTKY